MDIDPDELFRDDEDDAENEFYQGREATKEYIVYAVDASPRMFYPVSNGEDEKGETPFHVAISCISQSLKTQIINNSYDEVAICFFNTKDSFIAHDSTGDYYELAAKDKTNLVYFPHFPRCPTEGTRTPKPGKEKQNLQDLNGVYIFKVPERDDLDRPTARLIKGFSTVEDTYVTETFMSRIGSQYGIISGSRENSLYNALWVAQALLRKGSRKNADKRLLLFTDEDDPFGNIKGAVQKDMIRTTIQRAKDARDLGISIELFPLRKPNDEFNVSLFYADMIGVDKDDLSLFLTSAGDKLQDMMEQLRKRIFKKRVVRRITFYIANGVSIDVNSYALLRPTLPGAITWLDSVTNLPLKTERSSFCADTGALIDNSTKCSYPYKNKDVIFSMEELSEVKKISKGHLQLLGFKPLSCLTDYHNLRPSTFLFPSDEEITGSTCTFIALHRSMLRLRRFAVAFYGSSAHPHIVALIAQDEIISSGGQLEPPGMHMIYLPYSDDIRRPEEFHMTVDGEAPRATDDQIKKATLLLKRVDLKDFSVCQFANPALQRHYGVLQALALGEDEMPDTKDETVPDEEGLSRPSVISALEDFKASVYGENHDLEEAKAAAKTAESSRKRKATVETAVGECANYDWGDLADNGKLKDLTVVELKYYLTAHKLPVAGKKEALISRILTHLGK